MAQTQDEKDQAKAEARIAELETQLVAANEKVATAEAKATDLEGQLAAARLAAPQPVGAQGTVTVNAKGEVVE